ncbi:MAG: DUF4296 domain-containing protein, partial [Lentimicrobiaceae bacterium]
IARLVVITCLFLVSVSACRQDNPQALSKDQIIDREVMIRLMADMEITEAGLKAKQASMPYDSVKMIADSVYDSLCLYYKTTPELFKENLRYYQQDMEEYQKMLDDKITLLTMKKDSLNLIPEKITPRKITPPKITPPKIAPPKIRPKKITPPKITSKEIAPKKVNTQAEVKK